MTFSIKMDFTRKARFVARGDLATVEPSVTCSSVVSRDSIRLAFLIAGLNDLEAMACDLTNACLSAPCREKVWFVGGKDTGEDCGKVCVVDRAVCGLRSSGASWRAMLSRTLQDDLGFTPAQADPDVCRRPAEKDGFQHCEHVFVHVDDLLVLSKDSMHWIRRLQKVCETKEDSIKPPDLHLGAQVGKTQILNDTGKMAWMWLQTSVARMLLRLFRDCLMKMEKACN